MTAEASLVSVVVPAFNAETTLGKTLESISAQTHTNIEILIVDDGSTDRTAEIARGFCDRESRGRLLQKDNGGVASARNYGIGEARGEWIAPVDADDLWHATKLTKQLKAAIDFPKRVGFVYCWSHLIDEQGRVIGCPRHWTISGFALLQLAAINFVGNGSALLLSRDALTRVGNYDEGLRAAGAQGCEDLLLQLRIAAEYPIAAVPEHLVGYRIGSEAMSSDHFQMDRSWAAVFDRLRSEPTGIPPYLMRWARARRAFGMAASAVNNRDIRTAAFQLSRALRLDPYRFAVHLASRAWGRFASSTSAPLNAPKLPNFQEIEANECCTRRDGWIERLDAHRLSRLSLEETRFRAAKSGEAKVSE